MTKRNPKRPPRLILGRLPVETINRTIGTELDPGEVALTRAAQRHAARRHPDDYSLCLPHLGHVVRDPLLIGDDHRNPGKIELISRIAALGSPLLVAVSVELDRHGHYIVRSFYRISEKKIQGRKAKGFLKPALKR